jgi:hypothetical protein
VGSWRVWRSHQGQDNGERSIAVGISAAWRGSASIAAIEIRGMGTKPIDKRLA